jgi:Cu/Ag efflux protein CusF
MTKNSTKNCTTALQDSAPTKKLLLRILNLPLILAASFAIASCHSSPQETSKTYHMEGRVVSINKSTGEANIAAKAIPGFMAAMEMPYSVPDTKKLDELQPGDQVTADLVVRSAPGQMDAHLENIVVAQKAGDQAAASNPQRYHLDGKVVSVDGSKDEAVIDAKDIPGYMPAMAMPYSVPDKQELAKLKPGEHVTADVVVSGDDAHLEHVEVSNESK